MILFPARGPLRVISTALLGIALAAPIDLWLPPIGEPLRLSAHFDLPNGPYQAGHRGIDLPAVGGEAILSPVSGTVSFVGDVAQKPVLTVRLADGTLLSFEPVASELAVGDPVARGQPIGTVSDGDHCEAACLHLGVRVHGEYVNPLRFFWPKPVLLPW